MSKQTDGLLADFLSGTSTDAYRYLGSHIEDNGVVFRVWAPNARSVSVVGDFNDWNKQANYMNKIHEAGIWETYIKQAKIGDFYKYCVETPWENKVLKTWTIVNKVDKKNSKLNQIKRKRNSKKVKKTFKKGLQK